MHSACKRALADISLTAREELGEDNMRERRIFPLATRKRQTPPGEGGLIRYRQFIGIGSKKQELGNRDISARPGLGLVGIGYEKSIYFYFIKSRSGMEAETECP